jgi:hypothetical protein
MAVDRSLIDEARGAGASTGGSSSGRSGGSDSLVEAQRIIDAALGGTSPSGGGSSGGGGSSSGSCPPGYKKNSAGKCVPKSSSGSEYDPGEQVGGPDRRLDNGGAIVDGIYLPPGLDFSGFDGGTSTEQPLPPETPIDQSQQAYLEFLQQQAAAQKKEQQQSAKVIIEDLLKQYGLESLTDFVGNLIFKEDITSGEMILARLRSDKGAAGEVYRKRFAGNEARRAAGMNVVSEAEYLAMENTYRQIMRSAALPTNLFDQPDDLAALIGGDVSAQELSTRINDGYQAVQQSNPEVINQMRRLYGVSEGDLAAYFLDPTRATPYLIRQAQSAQIAGQAQLQAGQEISMTQAEQLATAGITQEQAQAGFQTIAQSQELFGPLAGTNEATIGVEEQIAGIFGQSAAAQQRIRQRQRERQATFEAGGRFAGQGSTVTGLQ